MPELPGATTELVPQAGAAAAGLNYLTVLGATALVADSTPRVYTNVDALLSVHGYCEAAEYVARHVRDTRKPVLFVPMPIADAGIVGRENVSGNSGSCVTTVTAGPSGALAETDGVLVVDTNGGGTIGTDQIKLLLSLDGGRTFKKLRLGTGNSYTIPYVGLTLAFGAGTLVAGDTVHVWHTTAPRWDGDGLTAARTALAGSQKQARSWLVVGDLAVKADATDLDTELQAYETENERFTLSRAQLRDRLPYAVAARLRHRMTGAVTVTFAEVGATGDTITRSAGSWIDDGFAVGDIITVSGSVSNNFTSAAKITGVTTTVITLDTDDLTDEGPVAGVTVIGTPSLVFAEVGATGDTITRSGGSWLDDGFRVGDNFTVSGSASNNITTTAGIAAVTATVITLDTDDLVAEIVGSYAVTITAGENKGAWIQALDAEFEDVRGDAEFRLDLTAGRARNLSPITGYSPRCPFAWAITIREYQHDLHIASWEKDLGALSGWDLEDTDDTGASVLVEFDERVDGGALAAGFSCARTWANGPAGTFVAMALTRADEGAGLQFTHNAHVANLACTVNQATTENAVGRSLVLDADAHATPDSLAKFKAEVVTALESNLLENKLGEGQRASSVDWTPATDDVLTGTDATLNGVLDLNLRGTLVKIKTRVRVN